MERTVVAAIGTAISAYIQQEEQATLTMPSARATPYPELSPWWLFRHQELLRTRIQWHAKRANR